MTILMYFHEYLNALHLELKLHFYRQRSTRFNELQRTGANWNESGRIQNTSLCMCEYRSDSPWHHDSFEHFKTFVTSPQTLAISATSNDCFDGRERTAKSLATFSRNPDSLQFAEKYPHSVTYACAVAQKFWHFAQNTTPILPCFVQYFKMIEQLKRMLWTNEISRDLDLRWVLDGYPILHIHHGSHWCLGLPNTFSCSLILPFLWIQERLFARYIWRSYLTGIPTAYMWRHLSNLNVVQRIFTYTFAD